jgi:hypothetical protein
MSLEYTAPNGVCMEGSETKRKLCVRECRRTPNPMKLVMRGRMKVDNDGREGEEYVVRISRQLKRGAQNV